MRPTALRRQNYLFMGYQCVGKSAAIDHSLIVTAKFNGVDPKAWLIHVLSRIAGYKVTSLDEFML